MAEAGKKEGGANKKRKGAPVPAADVCDDPLLSCPVCMEPFMGQVFQCHTGHTLCHNCIYKVDNKCPSCRCMMRVNAPTGLVFIRCIVVEQLAQKAPTSCGQGECKFVGPRESIVTHRKACDHRPFMCPSDLCKWKGQTRDEFVSHLHDKHTWICDGIVEKGKPYTMRLRITKRDTDGNWTEHLVLSQSESFILNTTIDCKDGLVVALMSVGASKPCKWMLSVGRPSECFSRASEQVYGIRDKTFGEVMDSGKVLLVMPSALHDLHMPIHDSDDDTRPECMIRLTVTIY